MTRLPLGRRVAGSALAFVLLPLQAQAPGDLWQVTTKMAMPGMNMPAQTSQVCAAKNWAKPPGSERPGCTSSGFAMKGDTATWDMTCTSPQSVKGHGEITLSGDSFKGAIKLATDAFSMTIELEGKKIGDCADPK